MKLIKSIIIFTILTTLTSTLHAEEMGFLEKMDIELHGFFDSRIGART